MHLKGLNTGSRIVCWITLRDSKYCSAQMNYENTHRFLITLPVFESLPSIRSAAILHCLPNQFPLTLLHSRTLEHSWHLNVLENVAFSFLFLFFFLLIWWPSSVFTCNISHRQVWLYYSLGHLHTQMFISNVWKYRVCILSFCPRQIWWIFELGEKRCFSEHSSVKYSDCELLNDLGESTMRAYLIHFYKWATSNFFLKKKR